MRPDEREVPERRPGVIASLHHFAHFAGSPVGGVAMLGQVPRAVEVIVIAQTRGVFLAGQSLLGEVQLPRSEEHTSELQSLMRISYAVFCLKKKKQTHIQ